jgi:hypothetical protein
MLESDVGEVSMMNARGELLFKAYRTYSMLTLSTGFDGGSLNETSIWVMDKLMVNIVKTLCSCNPLALTARC